MLKVQAVQLQADHRRFVHYPFQLYADNPFWAPPFLLSEMQRLNPKKNPFFKHASYEAFLARDGDELRGRVSVFVDRVHNKAHGEKIAFFGHFEAADKEAALALYERAEQWAVAAGMKSLRGPVSLTMEDGVGFLTNAYDDLPYMLMHYNGPEYLDWVQEAGYQKVRDFYAWKYYAEPNGVRFMNKVADRIIRRKEGRLTVRRMSRWHFKRDMKLLFTLYNEAWKDNWGFRPKDEEEYMFAVHELPLIFMPGFSTVLEMDGEPVGAVLSLPDVNQLMSRMGGRLLPFGWWHFLRRKRIFSRVRMAIMGVRSEWRGQGLETILIRESMAYSDNRGYTEGECSWVLEDNDSANKVIKAAGCKLNKVYRLYQKEL